MADDTNQKVQSFLNELESRLEKRPSPSARTRKAQPKLNLVEKVLPAVLSNLGLERKLKEHALMQVWESLLPEAIAKRSRPLFIDYQNNLVIAVSDASTAQELSLIKTKLVQNLAATARSLGIEIRSLRMDMKNFHRAEELEPIEEPALPHQPSDKELNELELSDNDKQLIAQLSEEKSSPPSRADELSLRIAHVFEKQLRLAAWRKQNGYPICQLCHNPVTRLFARGAHKVCFNCSVTE